MCFPTEHVKPPHWKPIPNHKPDMLDPEATWNESLHARKKATAKPDIRLMVEILHCLKDPKLWELWRYS